MEDDADDGDGGDMGVGGSDDRDADSSADDGEGSDDQNEENAEHVDLHLSGGMGIVKAGKRRLGANPSLESIPRHLMIAGVMVIALILFFLSFRRRRKETGKMN